VRRITHTAAGAAPATCNPTSATLAGSSHPAARREPITLQDIRVRAYAKWEAAGRPNGDSSRFWLEAEEELRPRAVPCGYKG
jgi:hypothetical protein